MGLKWADSLVGDRRDCVRPLLDGTVHYLLSDAQVRARSRGAGNSWARGDVANAGTVTVLLHTHFTTCTRGVSVGLREDVSQ